MPGLQRGQGGLAHDRIAMTEPWMPVDGIIAATDPRRHAPATERNRDAIIAVLRDWLPKSGTVLEVASGSGEHGVAFARAFPTLHWQPSDPDAAALASIAAYRDDAGLANLAPPILVDAARDNWPVADVATILCINMIHIAPWSAAEGLFAAASLVMPPAGRLILYGAFIEDDVPTAPSNLEFDTNLRARDPAWGLRSLAAVDALALRHCLTRTARVAMPANNLMLMWQRR